MENKKLIGILYDDNGKCAKVIEIKNVCLNEYNKFVEQEHECEQNKINEYVALRKRIGLCFELVETQKLYLAKALFDSFVDRGFIDDDIDLQKQFYEHIFNGADFKSENEHFNKILLGMRGI